MEALGAEIVHVYGLTEVYGPYTVCEWQPAVERAAGRRSAARLKARQGVGYLIADDVRVVDDEMNDVPADGQTLGEVVMRGNNTMKGYYHDPEATARAFRGGWFHSGDLAVMHPDGYIELRDRQEGHHHLRRREHLDHRGRAGDLRPPGRARSRRRSPSRTTTGARCRRRSSPSNRARRRPPRRSIAFCRERLARFKCPKAVEFGDLPKTSTGKIQKFVLREREWAGPREADQLKAGSPRSATDNAGCIIACMVSWSD